MTKILSVEKDIKELLALNRWGEVRERLRESPAPDVADLLEQLEPSARLVVFRLLPRSRADQVFSYLGS